MQTGCSARHRTVAPVGEDGWGGGGVRGEGGMGAGTGTRKNETLRNSL